MELTQQVELIGDFGLALAELQRHHLIAHPDPAELHPLLRDRIGAQLSTDLERRRALHRVAAAWHERLGHDPVEAALYHAVQAGDWAQVADLLTERAEALLRRGQAVAAADLIGAALARVAVAGPTDLTRRLLIGRGDLLANTERAEEAADDYRRALALTDTPGPRARIISRLATSLMQTRAGRRGAADHRDGPGGAARSRRSAAGTTGGRAVRGRDAPGPLRRRSRERRPGAGPGRADGAWAPREADTIRAQTRNTLGAVTHMRGQPDDAVRHWRAAAVAARSAGLERLECRAIFNIGNVYFVRGDLERALERPGRRRSGWSVSASATSPGVCTAASPPCISCAATWPMLW